LSEIGAFEAKNKLGSLLDRVQRGEEIVITRHGVAVARLVPNTRQVDTLAAEAALARLRARAEKVRPVTREDVLGLVKELAAARNQSFDDVLGEFRHAFQTPPSGSGVRNGVPLLPGGRAVTPEVVNQLRDELP